MSEAFRLARPDEISRVVQVVRHSFPGPLRTPEWWEKRFRTDPYGAADVVWVGEDEGRMAAACLLFPFRQWIGGTALPTMGLGTVAIAPTHRRRGLAGRFLTAALRHSRERGDAASALYPFRIHFYERLGYGLAGEAFQYVIPPELFPESPERDRMRLVESDADRDALAAVYDTWIRAQTGQIERTEPVWRQMLGVHDTAAFLYRAEGGEAEGYAMLRYRADLPPAERFLEVEERAWLTQGAQRAIYAWLGSLGDQWQRIAYRAHPEEGFENRIGEPRLPWGSAPGWGLWFPAATLLRGPMFRVLNLPAAWQARSVADEARLTLRLEVRDEQIPENRGPWRLRFEGGRVAVEPSPGGTADVGLALPTSALSRIFIGDLAPSAAVAAGLATADRPEALPRLDHALRIPRPWTFNRF